MRAALWLSLLPALLAAPEARVVVTSSVAHWAGYIDEASFRDHTRHRIGFRAYGQAKLANLIYARELARRTAGSGLRVNAFHPGGVATGMMGQPSPAAAGANPAPARPSAILQTPDRRIVRSVLDVAPGDRLEAKLADGTLKVRVEDQHN